MFDTYSSSGYELYQPFSDLDQWVIDDHNQSYHGNLKEVVKYMIQKLDFKMDDIEEALMLLADNHEDNALHFGIFKSPIYSFKKEVENERAS